VRGDRAASAELLAWFEPRRRAYPWRRRPTPYRVLVSEVMLQQTQAARVAPAFERFVAAFPSVRALAAAPAGDVLRTWGGLGYNRRAVALSQAARELVAQHGGRVPRDPAELRTLPGVGPYTADAVAAIAFGEPVVAADVNVLRVTARARLGTDPSAALRTDVVRAGRAWLGAADPADWNQALMDLGRDVCRSVPRCGECPIAGSCAYLRRGTRAAGGPSPGAIGPRAAGRRSQAPFRGSMRQVRGAVVRTLRARPSADIGSLVRETGEPEGRVREAVAALRREGIVVSAHGRVRLPG
jgi:A/G-specific adenine glycosylase